MFPLIDAPLYSCKVTKQTLYFGYTDSITCPEKDKRFFYT